ncbi:MAG: ABC transporter permease [Bacteroidales bacterium]|jgi:putative ABC transport system permease protein|nr:ABC transporter permease [Bacteroidales bacterium]
MAVKKIVKDSIIMIKLLRESVMFAISQLKGNKFRTFLSLFGVSIGIFSIIAIFTAVDGLDNSVKKGLSSLGGDVVQCSRWPMASEDENGEQDIKSDQYNWFDYIKREPIKEKDFRFLKANSKTASVITEIVDFNVTAKYNRNSINSCGVVAVSEGWDRIAKIDIAEGRYFSDNELSAARNVVVLGHNIVKTLFGEENPIGKFIKLKGRRVRVIGVTAEQGDSMINVYDADNLAVVPFSYGATMINIYYRWVDISVFAKPRADVSTQDFIDETRTLLRASRRLRPGQKNDFSINKMSFLANALDSLMSMLTKIGWIIAGFSLLVGGFGIANIMFVSVKERTKIIGIQKALGAKKYVILMQFLSEAVFLAIAGGIIGIILVVLLVSLIPASGSFVMTISVVNLLSGVLISMVIGIISGVAPAYAAARLDPVIAINSK